MGSSVCYLGGVFFFFVGRMCVVGRSFAVDSWIALL